MPSSCVELRKLFEKLIGKEVNVFYETSSGKQEVVSGKLEGIQISRSNPKQNYNVLNCVLDGENHIFVDGEAIPRGLSNYVYGVIKSVKSLDYSQNKVNPDRNI